MPETGKKLLNTASRCVEDSLEGFVAVNSGLQILQGHKVVVRSDIDAVKASGKVTLVAGGGSGHEPAFAGYVGPGMLSAAVAGSVFASPPPNSILAAIRTVGSKNPAGTLVIILNYTGDRLNFGLACERAKNEGHTVDMVVVDEDCALTSADKTAGKRGLCGAILVLKIAGALSEQGKSLQDIVRVCRDAARDMGTMGISLSPCSVPGFGPSFLLEKDEMELGLGVHGEAGVRRMKLSTAKEAVDVMFSHMTCKESSTHVNLQKGDQVALILNNLGGTSILEQNIIAKEAIDWLESRGVDVERVYSGHYLTSLEMAGVSLTVLHLDVVRTICLDAPTEAPGWHKAFLGIGCLKRCTPKLMIPVSTDQQDGVLSAGHQVDPGRAQLLHKAVSYACEAVGNCERQLNALDTNCGDGDCGSTLKRGADAILAKLGSVETAGLPVSHPHSLLMCLACVAEEQMGGASGGLYGLFFTACAGALSTDSSAPAWSEALDEGIQAIIRYGGAEPGDRTMLDALVPASKALKENLLTMDPLDAFGMAVQAAERGAQDTIRLRARAGRASYVSADHLTQPDPGAHAVGIWFRAAYEACKLSLKK